MGKILSWMKNAAGLDEMSRESILRLEAIREIENTNGFKMIQEVFEKQTLWATNELKRDLEEKVTSQLRQYLKALEVLHIFLNTIERNGLTALDQQQKQISKQLDLDAYHALTFTQQ